MAPFGAAVGGRPGAISAPCAPAPRPTIMRSSPAASVSGRGPSGTGEVAGKARSQGRREAAGGGRPRGCRAAASPRGDLTSHSLDLFAPAKINVFLRVTARRPDGYHDLASLFHVISLGDELTLEPLAGSAAAEDELVCDTPGVPLDASNLVLRALVAARKRFGYSTRFRATLRKRVPSGAGLGGGSGDAAAAIWGAASLAVPEMAGPDSEAAAELGALGAGVGSDVPVFFSLGAAYCTGRGEVVRRVPGLPASSAHLLLVKPPEGLPTPKVFGALDLSARSSSDPEELLAAALGAPGPLPQSTCVNDLQRPAFSLLPKLEGIRAAMAASGAFSSVFMSGSGSTIVGVAGDADEWRDAMGPPDGALSPDASARVPGIGPSSALARDAFVSRAVPITRDEGAWYVKPQGV